MTDEAKDVTELFTQAKEEKGSVEIKTTTEDNKEVVIVFNADAVNAIGDSNVNISVKVVTEDATVKDAVVVLEVKLEGATFADGEAIVTLPFTQEIPAGKIAKVYYVADDGTRTDMHATFADGKATFATNHFSTYAIVLEDEATGLSGGAIAGIVIAVVVVLAGVLLLAFWLKKKKGNGKNDDNGKTLPRQDEEAVDDNAIAENDIVSVGNENVPASELPSNEIASTVDNAEENGIVVGASRNDFNIRYEKSFMAKLIQSSDETKAYYGELKNEVLSYGKTKSHVSWAYDSVNAGRAPVLKFKVRGKTLCVYFALNVDDYANSKYKVEKAGSAKYESVPCMYRIKNNRRLGYAKDLIAAVCEKRGLTKGDVPTEDYRLPYESTEALLEKGLVKELPVATAKNESNA